jgi:pimeloyl-ACP methyl ester carboxylesterase
MNGMDGRMLRLPAPKNKKREILLLYGHHASLERMAGIAQAMNRYGAVTVPDLPGFGGMKSFYSIGEKPTLDNYADYLAAFMKLRYSRRRVTIVPMSFSFLVVTRMLQKYPDLTKKVDLLTSFVGFVHKDDFKFKPLQYWSLRTLAFVFEKRLPAFLMRHLVLRSWNIHFTYNLMADKHTKLMDANEVERKKRIDFEVELWQINDVRTYMKTLTTMLKVDLCNLQVDLPVYHVSVPDDRYFDNNIVEQHMRIIYKDFENIPCKILGHMPTVIVDAKGAAPFIPNRLRKLLR